MCEGTRGAEWLARPGPGSRLGYGVVSSVHRLGGGQQGQQREVGRVKLLVRHLARLLAGPGGFDLRLVAPLLGPAVLEPEKPILPPFAKR